MFTYAFGQTGTVLENTFAYPNENVYDEFHPIFPYPESKEIREKRLIAEENDTARQVMAHVIQLKKGDQLVYRDTLLKIKSDTQVFIPKGIKYRVSISSETKANNFYDRAKLKAQKHWWTQLVFNSIISYEGPAQAPEVHNEFKEAQVVYYPYEGKTISQIHIKQVDVLDGSVDDTTLEASTLLAKIANKLHVNTWERIIRNNLLVAPGESIFSYLVADNERLIRQLPYILDCRILVVNNPKDSSMVDLWVITEDKFSIGGDLQVGGTDNAYGEVYDQNILGTGHEVDFGIQYVSENDPTNDYRAKYNARNISGSFTDVTVNYRHYYLGSQATVDIGRGFINQFTKYAFGTSLGLVTENRLEPQLDSSYKPAQYTYNYQDGWLGRQFVIGDKHDRKSLIFIGRVKRYDAVDRPFVSLDSNTNYINYRLFMGGITFKRINYYKNNFINRFGVTEDIPHGYFMQYNFGYEDSEFKGRFYNSVTLGMGYRLDRLGYVSFINDFGTYIRVNQFEQAVYRARMTFLTNVVRVGRHKIRNSFYGTYISGINRNKDEIVNIENKLTGLAGTGLQALEATIVHYEIVDFTPWNVYGCRAALAVYGEAGWLQAGRDLRSSSDFYSAFGVSLRVRNESLAIKSIELSFRYYPTPTDQNKLYIIDLSTSTPGSTQLDLPLVPGVIPYQLR
ncbi:MAG TPA: hypothetical protein VK750_09105 [Cytophagaceae bacterium]|jgi:hypothetical protein|nr:hypothetical protein [Cytophagaceae bacterium]